MPFASIAQNGPTRYPSSISTGLTFADFTLVESSGFSNRLFLPDCVILSLSLCTAKKVSASDARTTEPLMLTGSKIMQEESILQLTRSQTRIFCVWERATERKTVSSGAAKCRPTALFVRTWGAPSSVACIEIRARLLISFVFYFNFSS